MRDLDGTTGRDVGQFRPLLVGIVLGLSVALPACGAHSANSSAASAEASGPVDNDPPPGADKDRLAQAVKLMDAGKLDESTKILEELHERYPLNGIVMHELGLVYRLGKHPDKTVALLSPHRDGLLPDTLAGLGSALDESGKPAEAEKVLRDGIAKHPNAGLLYSELATTLRLHGNNADALVLYEQGINVDPTTPSNYINAAMLLADSDRRGMTLIYGETFRLLEPDTDRSIALARVMVDVCDKAVTIEKKNGHTRGEVKLAPALVASKDTKKIELPLVNAFEIAFGTGLYLAHKDGSLTLASLHRAREAFVANIGRKHSTNELGKVPLFAWLRQVEHDGQLQAYDYWLYGPAFPSEWKEWLSSHSAQMDEVAQYLGSHPLFH